VVVVQVLDILLSVLLGLVPVPCVGTLGFGELVDLGADEADEGLLGEGVRDGFAWGLLVI
jgi:hypothetical protein